MCEFIVLSGKIERPNHRPLLHLFFIQCRWNTQVPVTVCWHCWKFYRRLATNRTSFACNTCTEWPCMRLFCHHFLPERPKWYICNGRWEAVRGSHWERPVWASHRFRSLESIDYVSQKLSLFVCEVAKPFFPRSMSIRRTKRFRISGWLVPFSWTRAAVNYSAVILWLKRSCMLAVCLRRK